MIIVDTSCGTSTINIELTGKYDTFVVKLKKNIVCETNIKMLKQAKSLCAYLLILNESKETSSIIFENVRMISYYHTLEPKTYYLLRLDLIDGNCTGTFEIQTPTDKLFNAVSVEDIPKSLYSSFVNNIELGTLNNVPHNLGLERASLYYSQSKLNLYVDVKNNIKCNILNITKNLNLTSVLDDCVKIKYIIESSHNNCIIDITLKYIVQRGFIFIENRFQNTVIFKFKNSKRYYKIFKDGIEQSNNLLEVNHYKLYTLRYFPYSDDIKCLRISNIPISHDIQEVGSQTLYEGIVNL